MSNGDACVAGSVQFTSDTIQKEPTVTVPAPLLLVRASCATGWNPRQDRPPNSGTNKADRGSPASSPPPTAH